MKARYHRIVRAIAHGSWIMLLAGAAIYCKKEASVHSPGSSHDARLAGAWLQEMSGGKDVSEMNVELIFDGTTATMRAPGCAIRGDYSTSGDTLTLSITSIEGERCSPDQKTGETESSQYYVTRTLLTLKAKGERGEKLQLFSKKEK